MPKRSPPDERKTRRPPPSARLAEPDKPLALARTEPGLPLGLAPTQPDLPIVPAQSEQGGSPALATTPPQDSFAAPTIKSWERYDVLALLGHGGMGAVYKARDRQLGRVVALKFLLGATPGLVQRFHQEARAQARLDHRNICKVYEVGEVEGRPYIAMQYVDGPSLQQASGELSLVRKVQVMQRVALALHYAHQQGIIHRDVKPSNIIMERIADIEFEPVIMDFGLARESQDGNDLTQSGQVMGTPGFMSPEQARGESRRVDARTDVYGLGATLYCLLTGTPPFSAATAALTILQVLSIESPSVRSLDPGIPESIEVIVSKCLNKEPAQRYLSAQHLAEDLQRFLERRPILGRRASWWQRLRFRATANRPLAAAVLVSITSLAALSSYGVLTSFGRYRLEQETARQIEQSKQLGQFVERMEWLVRARYSQPLGMGADFKELQKQISELRSNFDSKTPAGNTIINYGTGRYYLAIHDWENAYLYLQQAESNGFTDPDLYCGLGLAAGEQYNLAMIRLRRSGDVSFVDKQRAILASQYLIPAKNYLLRCRGQTAKSANYVDALLDFYSGHEDAALLQATFALRQAPWLYEAAKLQGDVLLARGVRELGLGDHAVAERSLEAARRAYERASEVGRSDYQLYDALAEVGIRQMELATIRGVDPQPYLRHVLNAADRAEEANPTDSYCHIKRAFAYLFIIQYKKISSQFSEQSAAIQSFVTAAMAAVRQHPHDEYAHDALGNAYVFKAEYLQKQQRDPQDLLETARQHFKQAIAINPRFPWAYNDLGGSYQAEGDNLLSRFQDPSERYQLAINEYQHAIETDPSYDYANLNIRIILSNIAHYKAQIGIDPSRTLEKSYHMSAYPTASNQRNIANIAVTSFSVTTKILYSNDSNSDSIQDHITQLNSQTNELLSRFPESTIGFQHRAYAYYLLARHQQRRREDPGLALGQSLEAVNACSHLAAGKDATCASLEALLAALQAERSESTRDRARFEGQAREAAQRTGGLAGSDNDALQGAAEAFYRVARLRRARGQVGAEEISAGLRVLAPVIARAPAWPRAQVVLAGLQALAALTAAHPRERESAASAARQALQAVVSGNPLLRNSYPEVFSDVAALSPLAAAPAPVSPAASHAPGR